LKVSIKHRLEYAGFRLLMYGLVLMPAGLAYGGVAALGQLFFLCSRRRQRYALRFLRQAYPEGKTDRELFHIARRATGNVTKVVIDMFRVHRELRRGTLSRHLEGIETILQHVKDEPALVVTGHLGSWEIGAIGLAEATSEAHVIARVFENPLLHRFIENSRRTAGLRLHSRRGGIRGLTRALKNGALVMQVVDQNQRLRGVFVPFFGRIASTERAAASLAVREGYPVVVGICERVGHGFRFRYRCAKVIRPDPIDGRAGISHAVKRMAAEINRGLEEAILASPEQYLWIHDRYRTKPAGREAELDEVGELRAGPEAV
jgi:KDO2-lipid IV(A) lauroyltransferase